MDEIPLAGGYVSTVVRVGDTVRRVPSSDTEITEELLRLFERHGWGGAPRFLGIDELGRQVLEFLPGHVATDAARFAVVATDHNLARVARLVRQFHDLTTGTALVGGQEVVCHNDLSPRNTIYRDEGSGSCPVAFIDWDIAAPGLRLHDVAHVCWQYVGLGPEVADVTEAARKVRLVCDSYGLGDRSRLVETVLWWQDRCWRGIEAEAAAGDPAKVTLRDNGAAAGVRAAHDWVLAHRDALEAVLAE